MVNGVGCWWREGIERWVFWWIDILPEHGD